MSDPLTQFFFFGCFFTGSAVGVDFHKPATVAGARGMATKKPKVASTDDGGYAALLMPHNLSLLAWK